MTGIERPTPDGDSLYMVMRDQKNGMTLGFERSSGEIMPILGIDNDGYLHLAKNIPEWTGIKTNDEGQIIREEEDSPELQARREERGKLQPGNIWVTIAEIMRGEPTP
nr:hypothetical protein [uncultured Dethiosulfovibrio sp.]